MRAPGFPKSEKIFFTEFFLPTFFLKIFEDLETVLHWKHGSGCILGCVFCAKDFLILQNFPPAAGMDPPRSTTKLHPQGNRSIYWLDQIALADFERE